MKKTILLWCSVLILALVAPVFAQKEDLQPVDLQTLSLSEEMVARVSNVLPSKPGDTFVQLRNGMTIPVSYTHLTLPTTPYV
jgi:hypothetical protein